MSDKLNQVGKAIGKAKKQAEFLLTRIGERFPQVERLRDTFSSVFPFLMEFETEVERNNLSLDLYFNPTYDFTQLCETFDATTATIQLQYSYTTLSVVVKFNDIVLTREVGYFETDPILGIVTISNTYITGEVTDVITICYAIDTSFCNACADTIITTLPDVTVAVYNADHVFVTVDADPAINPSSLVDSISDYTYNPISPSTGIIELTGATVGQTLTICPVHVIDSANLTGPGTNELHGTPPSNINLLRTVITTAPTIAEFTLNSFTAPGSWCVMDNFSRTVADYLHEAKLGDAGNIPPAVNEWGTSTGFQLPTDTGVIWDVHAQSSAETGYRVGVDTGGYLLAEPTAGGADTLASTPVAFWEPTTAKSYIDNAFLRYEVDMQFYESISDPATYSSFQQNFQLGPFQFFNDGKNNRIIWRLQRTGGSSFTAVVVDGLYLVGRYLIRCELERAINQGRLYIDGALVATLDITGMTDIPGPTAANSHFFRYSLIATGTSVSLATSYGLRVYSVKAFSISQTSTFPSGWQLGVFLQSEDASTSRYFPGPSAGTYQIALPSADTWYIYMWNPSTNAYDSGVLVDIDYQLFAADINLEIVEEVCGITDTFTRTTTAGDWGLSDSNDLWFIHGVGTAQTAYTDGSAGVLQLLVPNGSTNGKIFADFNNGVGIVGRDLEVFFDITFANTPLTGNIQLRCTISGQSATGVNESLGFTLWPPTNVAPTGILEVVTGGVTHPGSQLVGPSIVWTQTIHCHAVKAYDSVNNWMTLSVNAWNGTTEPAGWMVTDHTVINRRDAVSFLGFFLSQGGGTGGGANFMTASLDNLNVLTDGVAINNCTAVHYDNFSRFVTGGWGVTTPSGYTWVQTSGTATLSVTETGQTSTSAAAGVVTINDNFVTLRADTAPMSAGFTQTGRWAFSTLPVSNQRLFVACDASSAWTIKVGTGSETTFISIGGGGSAPQILFVPDTLWVANAWYHWEWILTPGVLNQFSIWREDSPGTVYTVHQVIPIATVPTDLALLDFDTVHYSATVYIDYIDFDDFAVPVATPVVCPDLILPSITTFAGIFYPQNVKVWLNNTDITYTLFGIDILNPNDTTNTWRNIDISNLIKSTGRHKLKVTTSSTGKVEARLTIR